MLKPSKQLIGKQKAEELKHIILKGEYEFNSLALEVFEFQKEHNPVYNEWLRLLKKDKYKPSRIEEIPFLPIELFKTHTVVSVQQEKYTPFKSSGTTKGGNSTHFVADIDWYLRQSKSIFEQSFFTLDKEVVVFALLPHYQSNGSSSLVAMVNYFIQESNSENGKFIPDNFQLLTDNIQLLSGKGKKVILFGVTYALLEFAAFLEKVHLKLPNLMIFETGGMKGRGKELLREELHTLLKQSFGVSEIYSEYGMTELLSQAYTNGGNWFRMNNTLKVLLRAIDNPLEVSNDFHKGAINVIDLNNIDSCSFLATADQGSISKSTPKGEQLFTVDGRLDNADIRGCNLLSLF